jgi:uncharacterized protein GlcG (DUF336 family)/quercetin dioxygenase-like cupin family protein
MNHYRSPLASTLLAAAILATGPAAAADTVSQPSITLQGAKRIVDAAISYAHAHAAPGAAVAVVDTGGHTILVERLDGTFPAGPDISIGKARTAVMFKRPTRALEETINKGRSAMIPVDAVTWFTPLIGGIPLMQGTDIVGGIGVSGAASAQQDEEVAMAGAQALSITPPQGAVNHIDATAVARAFLRGETGETLVKDPAFRVNASRRDGPGEAEIHRTDTDIFYVLEGRATVVTGGELLEPKETAPGEVRGIAIRGGSEQVIGRGDVLTIERGVPHWFKSVETPFRYYVIKTVFR